MNGGAITREDSIGYYHNSVIVDLHNSLTSTDPSLDDLFAIVSDKTAVLYGVSKGAIKRDLTANRSLFESILNERLFDSTNATDMGAAARRWSVLYPEKESQIEVLQSFFEGLSNTDVVNNDGTYFNKVLKIVDTSRLDNINKRKLRNAVIVGNASYQLWTIKE